MKLWIVGRNNKVPEDHQGHTWDLIGVCSSREKAIVACKDESYYMGPIELDEILPKEQVCWEGSYYPKRSK